MTDTVKAQGSHGPAEHERPRFSIAIPNYNYGSLIGLTIQSVLDQGRTDVEIHVADNASTDNSRDVVQASADRGVRLTVNPANFGMTANLDRAVAPTRGQWIVTLSSDDLMLPEALDTYDTILRHLGNEAQTTIVASSLAVIDDSGAPIDRVGPIPRVWSDDNVDDELSSVADCRVLSADPAALLRRSLLSMRNPLGFLATMYPRTLYDRVGGYRGGRFTNADKWFHWRLIAASTKVVFVDKELFGYRVHGGNQARQKTRLAYLKVMIDEYAYTFDVSDEMLELAGITRGELIDAFMRNDVIERGFAELHAGRADSARRYARLGAALYPEEARRRPAWWGLRIASTLGWVGTLMTRAAVRVLFAARATRKVPNSNGR